MNGWSLSGAQKANHHWQSGKHGTGMDCFKSFSRSELTHTLTKSTWYAQISESRPQYTNYGAGIVPGTELLMYLITRIESDAVFYKGNNKLGQPIIVKGDPLWYKMEKYNTGKSDYVEIDIKGKGKNTPDGLKIYVCGILSGTYDFDYYTGNDKTVKAYNNVYLPINSDSARDEYIMWGDGIQTSVLSQNKQGDYTLSYSDDHIEIKYVGTLENYQKGYVSSFTKAKSIDDVKTFTTQGFLLSAGIKMYIHFKWTGVKEFMINRLALAANCYDLDTFDYGNATAGLLPCFANQDNTCSAPYTISAKTISEETFNNVIVTTGNE